MEQTANIVSFPGLGWEFEIDRVAFHIGSLPVYWYGILIALGFILAILYVTKRAKEFGVDPDRMLDVVLGVVTVLCIVKLVLAIRRKKADKTAAQG